ncbi:hydroxylysine kinase [Belonocnema kinseyi]|uniref:hydroxylysine kinase n=1 Tax=Belonocnema kinseyi TaxID=2817044 RepID=UPI00143CE9A1|nr:hydroxylysine kinase [Belonocnema kinseyi]
MSNEVLLTPGQVIKPILTQENAIEIVEKLYGLRVSKITELNAYDDKNYHIIGNKQEFNNPYINEVSQDGYVLKIINSLDSKKTLMIEAQTELLLFLNKKGISCPLPVKCISGSYFSLQKINPETEEEHAVRLLVYLPGEILTNVPKTNELMLNVGKYVATLERILKEFSHPVYDEHQTIWMLNSVPKLREFLYVLENEEEKRIVSEVIALFEEKVLAIMDRFAKGIIHGDLNERNIVMSPDEKTVGSVIDFGDSHHSCVIFDLIIALCYMMMQSEDLESGKFVIRGYQTVRHLVDDEKSIIKVSVCARLCQSLVLGLYSYKTDPSNEYTLTTQKSGWKLLKKLWLISDEEIASIWDLMSVDNGHEKE